MKYVAMRFPSQADALFEYVETVISEGDYVSVLGNITLNGADGKPVKYSYCDVWRFRDGKMAELKAFVI